MKSTLAFVSATLLLTVFAVSTSGSLFGVDISGPTSGSAMQCIGGRTAKNEDKLWLNAVVRIGHYLTGYDADATQTLNNAAAADVNHVDGYIELCPKKQPNSSVSDYVNDILAQLKDYDVLEYVQTVFLTVKSDTAAGGDCWDSDSNTNIKFIEDALHVFNAMTIGRSVGVFTNADEWKMITNNYTGLPDNTLLWWASPGEPNFSDFVAFGRWSRAEMRQFQVSTASKPVKRCGLTVNRNVGQDYYLCQARGKSCNHNNGCCGNVDCTISVWNLSPFPKCTVPPCWSIIYC